MCWIVQVTSMYVMNKVARASDNILLAPRFTAGSQCYLFNLFVSLCNDTMRLNVKFMEPHVGERQIWMPAVVQIALWICSSLSMAPIHHANLEETGYFTVVMIREKSKVTFGWEQGKSVD